MAKETNHSSQIEGIMIWLLLPHDRKPSRSCSIWRWSHLEIPLWSISTLGRLGITRWEPKPGLHRDKLTLFPLFYRTGDSGRDEPHFFANHHRGWLSFEATVSFLGASILISKAQLVAGVGKIMSMGTVLLSGGNYRFLLLSILKSWNLEIIGSYYYRY